MGCASDNVRWKNRLALAVVLGALVAAPASALHRESPPAIRITSGGPHVVPPTRSWGNFFAFPSSVDLLQTGVSERQVYLWNAAFFDCNRGTTRKATPCPDPPRPSLIQLTETNRHGSPNNGSASANGKFIAFDADGSYGGGGGPQASHRQIFYYDLSDPTKPVLFQVTRSALGDSVRPTVNDPSVNNDAGVIVFESTAPLLGQNGPPGVSQVFLYFAIGKLIQLSDGAAPSTGPMPDANADRIVLESAADLLGDGHDTGITQIFFANVDHTNLTAALTQLTAGNAPSHHPYITEKFHIGNVVFESTATNFPRKNNLPGPEIFMVPTTQGALPLPKELTPHADNWGDCHWPSIDAGGQHITCICDGDYLHNNTTGNRVFLFDTNPANKTLQELGLQPGSMVPQQITGRGDVQGPLTQNIGIFFVTFADRADVSGTGACGYQLQVVDFYDIQPGHWVPAIHQGELPPDLLPDPFTPPPSNFLGTQTFDILPGDSSTGTGSLLQFTTQNGVIAAPTDRGRIELEFAPYNVNGKAAINVPQDKVKLPPIPIPGVGVMCLQIQGDGDGIVDCNGGRAGGDLTVTQDHDARDTEPNCCPENASCQPGLPGPHTQPCATCPGGVTAVCNGPVHVVRTGTLRAGGVQLRIPVDVDVATRPDQRGDWCTQGNEYLFTHVGGAVVLTTESVNASITDVDNSSGLSLATAPDIGTPLDCNALNQRLSTSLRLVGAVPVLDVPVPGYRDVIINIVLATRSRPLSATSENDLNNTCYATLCTGNAQCDDGNPCNGSETCVNSTCVPGIPLWDDGDACNGVEGCDPVTLAKIPGVPPVCADASLCTFDTCLPSVGCVHVSTCDDNNPCNGTELCQESTGACFPGAPLNCDDGNPCTNDACDPTQGCTHTANTAACNDNNACTTGDVCSAGTCTGTPVNCSDNNACNGLETCNLANGTCLSGTAPNCDDGNTCTTDSCAPATGCVHTNNTAPCNDGSACTTGDVCQNGTCGGTVTVFCSDGNACNGVETCNPATGTCLPGTAPNCNDGNPCTDDSCAPATGCVHTNNTAPCNDGNVCTSSDACLNGVCQGTAAACSDGNACNGVETCNPATGSCNAGQAPNCNDGNPCTTDSCDPLTGCTHTPIVGPGCVVRLVDRTRLAPSQGIVNNSPPDKLGGRLQQQRIDRLLGQARTLLKAVSAQPQSGARRRIRTAMRRIQMVIAIVNVGGTNGAIDSAVAGKLVPELSRANSELTQLVQ